MRATADSCPPVYATPLTPGRPNLLAEARGCARMLGFDELSPWQEHVLALATEYEEGNPRDGVVPYWRFLTVSVPRQCGKSECVVCVMLLLRWMGFYEGGDPKMVYTSFSIESVQDQWDTKIGKRIGESEWGVANDFWVSHNAMNLHARLGKKNLKMVGGRVRLLSNSGKSGRGGTEDLVIMDEAREFGDDDSREKTLMPLLNMRPSPQLVITSTMGTEAAGYFCRKVSAGREQARSQLRGEWPVMRLAYAEWGVGDVEPEGLDASSPSVWRRAHPMLGWGHWNEERMAEQHDLARSEHNLDGFKQEYLNCQFALPDEPGVPWELLDSVERAGGEPIGWGELGKPVVLGLFAEAGGRWLSAAAAGGGKLKVVRPVVAEGEKRSVPVEGVLDWLGGYLGNYPQIGTIAVREGTDLEAYLRNVTYRGVRIVTVPFGEWKDGCRLLLRAFKLGEAEVERNDFLRIAVAAAERVDSADRATWYWARKKLAQAPIDELQAAVLAWTLYYRLTSRRAPAVMVAGEGNSAVREQTKRWEKLYAG